MEKQEDARRMYVKIEVALLRSYSRTNIEFIFFFFLDFYNLDNENNILLIGI